MIKAHVLQKAANLGFFRTLYPNACIFFKALHNNRHACRRLEWLCYTSQSLLFSTSSREYLPLYTIAYWVSLSSASTRGEQLITTLNQLSTTLCYNLYHLQENLYHDFLGRNQYFYEIDFLQ